MAFCVLCVAMCTGTASAQELSNFETCVSEARQNRADAEMPNYLSYKCDGPIAQKLAARPDQCYADIKPSLRNIDRWSRQLADGLYLRMIWRTEVCAGMCETRIYSDARPTNYLCEVRRHTERRIAEDGGEPVRTTGYYRRDSYDYPPERRVYGPARTYQPDYYTYRRPREAEGGTRVSERWYYIEPRYRTYRYPDDDADDDRREEYRRDDDRRDGYRRDDDREESYRRDSDYRRDDYSYRRRDDYHRGY
jgi:hypothetical protein